MDSFICEIIKSFYYIFLAYWLILRNLFDTEVFVSIYLFRENINDKTLQGFSLNIVIFLSPRDLWQLAVMSCLLIKLGELSFNNIKDSYDEIGVAPSTFRYIFVFKFLKSNPKKPPCCIDPSQTITALRTLGKVP